MVQVVIFSPSWSCAGRRNAYKECKCFFLSTLTATDFWPAPRGGDNGMLYHQQCTAVPSSPLPMSRVPHASWLPFSTRRSRR